MPSHVPLYYPLPSAFGVLLPDPVNVTTAVEVGPLGVEIYDIDNTLGEPTFIGFIPDVLSAEVEEGISAPAQISFVIPAARATILSAGQEFRLIRQGDGEIARGIVENRAYELDSDRRTVVVTGVGVEALLGYANPLRTASIRGLSGEDALDYLLSYVTGGWTGTLISPDPKPVTRRYDNQSVLAALYDFAKIQNAFVRRTGYKSLEVRQTLESSGMRLVNFEELPRSAPSNVGIIESIKLDREGSNLWNLIVPYGETSGGKTLTLAKSTRSIANGAPYDIGWFSYKQPEVIHALNLIEVQDTTGPYEERTFTNPLWCAGFNRAVVAWFSIPSASTTGLPFNIRVGSKLMEEFFDETNGSSRIKGYYLLNPDPGWQTIVMTSSFLPANGRWTFASLANVYQDGSPIRSTAFANGTGTAASVSTSVGGTSLGDLLIDRLVMSVNADSTPGTGQTDLGPGISAGFGRSSSKVPVTSSDTLTWTISASRTWLQAVASIMPARNYYIYSQTSVNKYRSRHLPKNYGSFEVATDGQEVSAANTLYDRALDDLEQLRHDATFCQVKAIDLPLGPRDWFVGDTFDVLCTDPQIGINIDDTLVCVKRRHVYTSDGIRTWDLTLSDVQRFMHELGVQFQDMLDTISNLQSNRHN